MISFLKYFFIICTTIVITTLIVQNEYELKLDSYKKLESRVIPVYVVEYVNSTNKAVSMLPIPATVYKTMKANEN